MRLAQPISPDVKAQQILMNPIEGYFFIEPEHLDGIEWTLDSENAQQTESCGWSERP